MARFDGIGGYDLADQCDLGFASEYDRSGRFDHFVFYRPDDGACHRLKKASNKQRALLPADGSRKQC